MFQVTIVGRPNVGKSTLFNRLCGFRKSIVGDEPGITRDRIYGSVRWNDKSISFLDTGGLIPDTREVIPEQILNQATTALSESQLVLIVVDGRAGITPLDELLLPMLRKSGKPVWTVVNKIDTPALEMNAASFYQFGTERVFAVSAEHGPGTADLLDAIAERIPAEPLEPEAKEEEEIAVAVVGRPNVGKSSLVNCLLGFERSIVTDVPGTTRDSVDTLIVHDGVQYRIIDTAGIRRKGKPEGVAEKISVVMAQKSLEKADVALLLLDAEEGVTKQDAGIGGYASDSGCSVIIVLNKWDLVEKDTNTLQTFTESIHRRMKYLQYAPIVSVSALTGQRVPRLFDVIRQAHEARHVRIPTGMLNNMFVPDLEKDLAIQDPNKNLGIRYITQARTNPPTFVVFVAGRERLHFSTERHLVNRLREQFGFFATPVRIQQRLKPPKTSKRKDPKK
ncbi:MAG TPA: ribosome biogenesis GTPase Der [Acidobacteriota bacterium]|nr:ribosome biogenesis GTPase Der [Acidobacteriota bacterium]